jgi:hypothetical protein
MRKPFVKQMTDVIIIKTVKNILTFTPYFHQPQIPQNAQLVRYKRVGCPENRGNVTDTELLLRQEIDNAQAGRISQNLERFGKLTQGPGR